MQSNQDLKLILSELETLHTKVRDPNILLDEAVEVVSKFGTVYRAFKQQFAKETMDVQVVELGKSDQAPSYTPFAWKNL